MPLSESGSESSGSYETSASESESSSGDETLMRPVFLKKSKASSASSALARPAAKQNTALDKAERLHQVEQKTVKTLPFDGVEDTDNVDPKAEYEAWQKRERARRERDLQRVREAEEAKEDAVRRKL